MAMMDPVPVNRQTVPRVEREDAILAAAAVEFAAAGFDEAKVAAIARRAGMTSANVHYYFESKDALVAAVADRAYERLFAELAEVDDPVARLDRYVAFHLASHSLRGQLQAIAMRCPALAEVLRRRERWVADAAARVAGDPLDADALAAVVTGLIEVVVPHADPRVVLQHSVARLVGRKQRRTA
jgi:TetR/AcrR family transcriptional repressor of mexAB-oprM operon